MRNGLASRKSIKLGKGGIHLESGHKSSPTGANIPIASDLNCISLIHHGIEDGLLRKSWRELRPTGLLDELQLLGSDGAIECQCLHGIGLTAPSSPPAQRPIWWRSAQR